MNAEQILQKLTGVSETSNGWQAQCPAHDDRRASLSIGTDDGKTLLYCHRGCTTERVVQELGLQMSDLFSEEPEKRSVVATYNYQDRKSKLRFQIVRYNPKGFKARRPDGNGGWVYSVEGIELIPYRLPTIVKHRWVLITEGEKDADTGIRELRLPATTNPFGADAWKDEYSVHFAGKTVILCPDNDEAGRKHMQAVACSLFPVAKKIKIIELPFGKDLTEWCKQGGTRQQFIALDSAASCETDWNG
jgi:hypothetical protein